jgi:hypothetical protein
MGLPALATIAFAAGRRAGFAGTCDLSPPERLADQLNLVLSKPVFFTRS